MKRHGASTFKQAQRIRDRYKAQGYGRANITKNPKSIVGKHNIKPYTVEAGFKTKK